MLAAGSRSSMRGGGSTSGASVPAINTVQPPSSCHNQALVKAGRVFSELPGQRQRVQLRQRGRFGSGVVRATRARRELFGARDHSHRRHVHVTLRADGEELRCVTIILR